MEIIPLIVCSKVRAAAQQLRISESGPGHMLVYRNGDGKFSKLSGSDRVFMMCGNFGDLDNDGYLDMYPFRQSTFSIPYTK